MALYKLDHRSCKMKDVLPN